MPLEPVEALLLTVHMAVYLMVVMVVVLLATVTSTISGKKRPRKYTQRKPKEDPAAPPCPDCPYGYGRKKRSGDKYKATCSTCYADKKNGRTRRQSSSASEEDGAAESSQQGNTGTSASTLRRSSGDIVSPRPNHAGRAPRGHTWNGSQYQADDPTAPQNVARRTHARGGRGFSTLQAGWKTDFPWMHCEKDTELMAATGGRCVTELSAADCEECVGCHLCSRMYCKHCRSRTGNAFSADVGCRTFKRDELARHERIFHPEKLVRQRQDDVEQ